MRQKKGNHSWSCSRGYSCLNNLPERHISGILTCKVPHKKKKQKKTRKVPHSPKSITIFINVQISATLIDSLWSSLPLSLPLLLLKPSLLWRPTFTPHIPHFQHIVFFIFSQRGRGQITYPGFWPLWWLILHIYKSLSSSGVSRLERIQFQHIVFNIYFIVSFHIFHNFYRDDYGAIHMDSILSYCIFQHLIQIQI